MTITDDSILVDKSGNGHNAYIRFKDFTGTAIPYKSAAYIQQNIANYGHLNDSNHFWFNTTTHTANLIPVTSLFQDIDYAHTTFCRHVAQVLDGNGVETTEPYVSEIVNYSDTLTTTLTAANSYFGVPVEATTNMLWVDPTYTGGANDGSKAKPYTSLSAANTAAAAGVDTVYCRTGAMTDGVNGNIYALSKAIAFISTGNCVITGTATTTAIYQVQSVTGLSLNGFTFNGSGSSAAIIYINTNATNLTINRCRFNNTTTGVYTLRGINNTVTGLTITNNVFVTNNNVATATLLNSSVTMQTNFFNCTSASNSGIRGFAGGEISHNKFYHCDCGNGMVTCEGTTAAALTIKDNLFDKGTVAQTDITTAMATRTGTNEISYNTFLTASNKRIIASSGSADAGSVLKITNNTITHTPASASTDDLIIVTNQSNVIVRENLVTAMNTTGSFINIIASTTSANTMSGVVVDSNTITSVNAGGYIIKVGSDGANATSDYKITGAQVIGNSITANWTSTATTHSILLGYTLASVCKYNWIHSAGVGIVVKGTDNASDNGVIAYNLITDCNVGFLLKGCRNNLFYNNTIVSGRTTGTAYGIEIVVQVAAITQGNTIENNIIYMGANAGGYCVYIDHANQKNNTLDYNNYYHPTATNMCLYITTPSIGWNDFKALNSYEAHGTFALNALTDYIPDTPIPGATLDAAYNTGLSVNYNWTTNRTTQQQGTPWQIGCYIQELP